MVVGWSSSRTPTVPCRPSPHRGQPAVPEAGQASPLEARDPARSLAADAVGKLFTVASRKNTRSTGPVAGGGSRLRETACGRRGTPNREKEPAATRTSTLGPRLEVVPTLGVGPGPGPGYGPEPEESQRVVDGTTATARTAGRGTTLLMRRLGPATSAAAAPTGHWDAPHPQQPGETGTYGPVAAEPGLAPQNGTTRAPGNKCPRPGTPTIGCPPNQVAPAQARALSCPQTKSPARQGG